MHLPKLKTRILIGTWIAMVGLGMPPAVAAESLLTYATKPGNEDARVKRDSSGRSGLKCCEQFTFQENCVKRFLILLTLVAGFGASSAWAQTYRVDPVHSFVIFRVRHANVGYVWGRFNDPAGSVKIDADAAKDSFAIDIQAAKVDTHQEKRDAHLKSPDFLNVRQYPLIRFKSTAVKKVSDTQLEVTGDLTLHGVTKPITVPVELTGSGEFPPGVQRIGLEATFVVKTTDFEIKGLPGMVAEDVRLTVALECAKQ